MVEDKDRRGRILKKKKGYRQNQRKNNINKGQRGKIPNKRERENRQKGKETRR